MYSQGLEEEVILKFFKDYNSGTFLDIGAFHPKKFSNTRALYEKGFKGVFVEPSPTLIPNFQLEYSSDNDIQLLEVCVGLENKFVSFFDSGGDAISTTIESETVRWVEAYNSKFTKISRQMVTVSKLLNLCKYQNFDFINIDTEGNVFEILNQFDLHKLGTKLVCVEWNGKDRTMFDNYISNAGMNLIFENSENLIFGI